MWRCVKYMDYLIYENAKAALTVLTPVAAHLLQQC